MVAFFGLLPVLILFLALWALTDIWRSARSTRVRAIWSAIALVPFVGFLLWLAIGPRAA